MLLTDLLAPERIKIPLVAATKSELLEELVQLLTRADRVEDPGDVLRAVREREAVLSTGIGNGVAIPHGKSSAVPELRLAAGRTAEPVDFDALDGQPVRLLFLLVGPETDAAPHIKALSRISRLLRQEPVRQRLIAARDAGEFYRALSEAEGVLAPRSASPPGLH
ncbi:MAG: PTS sugar transporter subunit IIA [Gemmatimonadetes bacterium]|nr:PTS sugar transporter subunit IIA [Gemmatimonadota bacterium]